MKTQKQQVASSPMPVAAPAMTPEARENQLINLAIDCVEQRMRDGTATAQELCYYLKLGSQRERLEKQILEEQAKLYKAKAEALASAKRTEELYNDAILAMRKYSGHLLDDEEQDLY